eukprot:s623_g3.t1
MCNWVARPSDRHRCSTKQGSPSLHPKESHLTHLQQVEVFHASLDLLLLTSSQLLGGAKPYAHHVLLQVLDTGTAMVDASDPCASRGGRLLTVASVGFIAGGALTVRDRDPLASALLSAI